MASDEDRIMRYVENTWIDILSWGLGTWHAYSSWTYQYDVRGSPIGGDKAIRLYSDDDGPGGLGIYLLDTFYPVVGSTVRPSSDHAPVLLSPHPPQVEIKYTHPEPKLEVFTPDDVAAPDALAFRLLGCRTPRSEMGSSFDSEAGRPKPWAY